MPEKNKMFKKIDLMLVLVAIVGGIFLRLYRFDTIPFGINHDSSAVALEAIDLSQHPWPYRPYSEIDSKGETLLVYFIAGFIKILGPTPQVVKLASTLISLLLLPFFFLFVQELFGKKTALLSLFLLASSGWHLIMGKTAWPAITLPVVETIFFYSLFKTVGLRKYSWSILSGLLFALTLNTYNASKIVPFFLAIIFIISALRFRSQDIKKYLPLALPFILTFSLFIFPLARYAVNNWQRFNSRSASVSVGERIKKTGNLSPLWENIKGTTLMFNVRAGGNDFFVNEPLLDSPSSYFFILGLLFAVFSIKNFPYQFILLGWLMSLIPGLLSVPNGNRDIGALPFVYLFAGLGLAQIFDFSKKVLNSKIALGLIVILVAFSFTKTYGLYLGDNRRELFGFYPETTVVGNYMKDKLDDYDFYLTDNYPRDALTFLTYQGGNPWIKHYTWLENKFSFLKVWPKADKGTVFIMFKADDNLPIIQALQNKLPQGKLSELQYKDGPVKRPAAWVFTLEKRR